MTPKQPIIHIEINNHTVTFQLTDQGVKAVQEAIQNETKLLGKYTLSNYRSSNNYQHNKSFGSNADYEFCTNTKLNATFRLEQKKLEINTYADGGMTALIFTEKDKKVNARNSEDQLINYTLKFLTTLIQKGFIKPQTNFTRKPEPIFNQDKP